MLGLPSYVCSNGITDVALIMPRDNQMPSLIGQVHRSWLNSDIAFFNDDSLNVKFGSSCKTENYLNSLCSVAEKQAFILTFS